MHASEPQRGIHTQQALGGALGFRQQLVEVVNVAEDSARVLEKAGKSIGHVRRVEVNEAFSSVAVNSVRMLDADPDTVNVNGGAVALGHPIGASGARILSTLVYELRREGGGLGLAAICSGGGQGDALLIEV